MNLTDRTKSAPPVQNQYTERVKIHSELNHKAAAVFACRRSGASCDGCLIVEERRPGWYAYHGHRITAWTLQRGRADQAETRASSRLENEHFVALCDGGAVSNKPDRSLPGLF